MGALQADYIPIEKVTHVQALHNKVDAKCWVTVADKEKEYKQRHHKYKELIEDGEQIINNINAYISMNAFYSTYRRAEYLRQLNTLYIDLDVYNTPYNKEQVLMQLREEYFNIKIPQPSMIVDSGRGLYLIWTLKKTPSQALPLWNGIESFLYNQLREFGADRKALDCTRVLRVPGTLNTKSNTIVEVLDRFNYDYELRDIQRDYLPLLEPKEITKKRKGRKPTVISLFTTHSLHYARMQDLIKLCELRDWDVKGSRENILFLYRMFSICFTEDKEKALEDALEINSQFLQPLKEREVIRATKSAEKKEYKYKNETLIELLDISLEEQKHLRTIISKAEANEREKVKKKNNRRNENGLIARAQRKLDNFNQVKELYEQGLKQVQIVEITGLSKGYISKTVKQIKEQ